jgi:endonuclease/exonuclease/phosphatase (EEP) superfamily protein YafD
MAVTLPSTPRRSLLAVVDLPAYGLAAATLAGFAGRWHWLLDLASHFRWYWLLATLVWFAIASRRHSRLALVALVIAAIANTLVILPYWLPTAGGTDEGESLEIVSLNLLAENDDKGSTLAYLRQRGADVVVLLEVDGAWAEAIEQLEPLYPHRIVEPRDDHFGIAVLSQLPLEEPRVELVADGPPVVITGVPRGKNGFLLLAAHPQAPISAAWSALRDAQLAALGERAAKESRPVIVAGDMNASPWSHGFRQLLAPGNLRDSALGRGLQPTWNARRWFLRIPIDHIVVSPGVRVTSRSVGPDVGSDHLPVEATLVLP